MSPHNVHKPAVCYNYSMYVYIHTLFHDQMMSHPICLSFTQELHYTIGLCGDFTSMMSPLSGSIGTSSGSTMKSMSMATSLTKAASPCCSDSLIKSGNCSRITFLNWRRARMPIRPNGEMGRPPMQVCQKQPRMGKGR